MAGLICPFLAVELLFTSGAVHCPHGLDPLAVCLCLRQYQVRCVCLSTGNKKAPHYGWRTPNSQYGARFAVTAERRSARGITAAGIYTAYLICLDASIFSATFFTISSNFLSSIVANLSHVNCSQSHARLWFIKFMTAQTPCPAIPLWRARECSHWHISNLALSISLLLQ